MSPDDFSALAKGIGPEVQAKAIFETVQFRIGAKAFATLGWPAQSWAVLKLAPSRQAWALSLSEGVAPEPGRRRNAGIVLVQLAAVDHAVVGDLLAAAYSFAHRASQHRNRPASPGVGFAQSRAAAR